MADLVLTASSIVKGSGAQTAQGTAGAALTAGMVLYLDSATTTLKPADANLSAAASTVVGIALHAAAVNQPIVYLTAGNLTTNAVLTAGKVYVLSATDNSGAIAPVADLASGWFTSILGYATTTTNLVVGIINSGTAN